MTTEPEAIPADVLDTAQRFACDYYNGGSMTYGVKEAIVAAIMADRASRAPVDGAGWQPIETAPKGETHVLLNLGETIPDLVDARVGQFITEKEAAELGETVSASGGWIIWDTGGDWFVVPYADVFGWAPLPAAPGTHPAPASPDAEMVRPIVGIENRTAQEVFDIMSDRTRLRFSKHGGDRS